MKDPFGLFHFRSVHGGCYQTQAPQPNATLPSHRKENTAGQRQTQATHTHTQTNGTGQWLKNTMYISSADGKRKDVELEGQSGRKVENLRTNTPSGFITNRVIMVFSRTEDKQLKMV